MGREARPLAILVIRLLPIPGYLSSYIVGTMPSVGLWTYIWTEAISVVPYYLGSVLIFLGVVKNLTRWLFFGGCLMAVVWGIGFLVQRRFKTEIQALSTSLRRRRAR
ncbi:hypothetical protein GCM10025857_31460 [Alicyclobacillus contaminans]|nr:hypothetical protein GCM10025857_31460 [Alicyclobacillus contaminans]